MVAQNMKIGTDALGTDENDPGAQNMKNEPGAIGTAKNDFRSAKHEKSKLMPSLHPKTSPGA
jgi:hypothetical protein